MTDYFHEMGWQELEEGERPDQLLQMARSLLRMGFFEDIAGEWSRLAPPASKEAVKNLREVVIESEVGDCIICLKKFSINVTVKQMPCNHMFHAYCILKWLSQTNSCPFCRYELPTDNEGYEAFRKEKKRAVQRKEDIKALHNSMFT